MLCKKCGYSCDDNAQFCDKCGAPLASQEGIAVKKHDNSTLRIKAILISACAFAVLAIGVVAALLIINNTPSARVNRYLTTAEKYLVEMNYEQAVIEFQRVLEIEPMNVDAYLGLAEAYIGLGDTEKALEVLREGLKLTGDSRLQAKIDELTKPKEPPVSSSTSSLTSSEHVEDEPPEYGSMGFVTVAGTELDIATTESLLIYNKELYKSINKYTDLEKLENGFSIVIFLGEDLSDDDLSELSKLSNLKELQINCAGISDISFVSKLTNLTKLLLYYNQISDITPLTGLKNLTYLSLGSNQISELTLFEELTNLTRLELWHNQISDITPLAGLTNLTRLDLRENQIRHIEPLAELTNLNELYLNRNQISDSTPLAGLTNLTNLWLSDNQISDITPLAGLTNLTNLWLHNNQISDITPLAGLTKLKTLRLRNNIAEIDKEWLKGKLPECDDCDIY